jgi:hypothetical protein
MSHESAFFSHRVVGASDAIAAVAVGLAIADRLHFRLFDPDDRRMDDPARRRIYGQRSDVAHAARVRFVSDGLSGIELR